MPTSEFTTQEAGLVPARQNVYHPIDELGIYVGLERLHTELAEDFRERILDAFVHKANATYIGSLIGMNRELGFLMERAIVFTLRDDVNHALGPRIDINQTSIEIFSAFNVNGNKTKELSISIFDEFLTDRYDYHARYIGDVVDLINQQSLVFAAELSSEAYRFELASSLVPTSSVQFGLSDSVRHEYHDLGRANIIPGSLVLSDSRYTKLTSVSLTDWDDSNKFVGPTDLAEYFIDYEVGKMWFATPPGNLRVAYMYHSAPLTAYYMPVELYTFTDHSFQQELYEPVVDENAEVVNGMLTNTGARRIDKILLEARHFWSTISKDKQPIAADPELQDILSDLVDSTIARKTTIQKGINFVKERGV